MNFNASKIHQKIVKKEPGLILPQGNLLVAYVQDMREIPAIVNEKIVIKC